MAGKFFCIDFISFLLSLFVIDKKIYKKILQNEG